MKTAQKIVRVGADGASHLLAGDLLLESVIDYQGTALPRLLERDWRVASITATAGQGGALVVLEKDLRAPDETLPASSQAVDDIFKQAETLRNERRSLVEAIALYNRAIRFIGHNAYYYFGRGYCYQELQQFEEACVDFSRAIALLDSNAYFYHHRAECLRRAGQFERAMKDCQKALLLLATNEYLYFGRGECLREMGRFSEALADYDAAIRIHSGNLWFFWQRSDCHRRLGRKREAVADCRKALELGHPNPDEVNRRIAEIEKR